MRLILTTAVLSVLLACGHTPSAPSEHSTTDTIDTIPAPPMPEPYDTVAIHILLGKFNPAKEPGYVRIADQYSAGSGRGAYLHKESYEAFVKMAEAAKADGVTLTIISATRNFNRQKAIWKPSGMASGRLAGGTSPKRWLIRPNVPASFFATVLCQLPPGIIGERTLTSMH